MRRPRPGKGLWLESEEEWRRKAGGLQVEFEGDAGRAYGGWIAYELFYFCHDQNIKRKF